MEFLFLTPEERTRLFETLPDALRDAWKSRVREETITVYESPEELQTRMRESKFADHAGIKGLFDKMVAHIESDQKTDAFDAIQMEDFPTDALPSFLFTIGACGVEAFMEMLLQEKNLSAEDLESIASLSRTRHRLLQMNAVLV